eukprot:c21811_g1_i1 orf=118-1107(+)
MLLSLLLRLSSRSSSPCSRLPPLHKRTVSRVPPRSLCSFLPDKTMVGAAAVLYHYPCPDGAFAALAAHLYHSALRIPVVFFPNTVYTPLRAQDLQTDHFDAFYLLDFVGPEGFVAELCSKAKNVIILDHHKTALERLLKMGDMPSNLVQIFDMNRSGATIAYDYFTDKLRSYKLESAFVEGDHCKDVTLVPHEDLERVELLYKYIEDADIWKWSLPNSKAFSSGLNDAGIEFSVTDNPRLFEQLLALDPADVSANGARSLSAKQILIDRMIQKSFEIKLGEGKFGQCLAVKADGISKLRSELGNQLATKSLELGLRPIMVVGIVGLVHS